MQNKAGEPNFSKIKILVSPEISGGNKFHVENMDFLGDFWAIYPDFRHFYVEISEVLPVEISAEKSGLISIFTGKKN